MGGNLYVVNNLLDQTDLLPIILDGQCIYDITEDWDRHHSLLLEHITTSERYDCRIGNLIIVDINVDYPSLRIAAILNNKTQELRVVAYTNGTSQLSQGALSDILGDKAVQRSMNLVTIRHIGVSQLAMDDPIIDQILSRYGSGDYIFGILPVNVQVPDSMKSMVERTIRMLVEDEWWYRLNGSTNNSRTPTWTDDLYLQRKGTTLLLSSDWGDSCDEDDDIPEIEQYHVVWYTYDTIINPEDAQYLEDLIVTTPDRLSINYKSVEYTVIRGIQTILMCVGHPIIVRGTLDSTFDILSTTTTTLEEEIASIREYVKNRNESLLIGYPLAILNGLKEQRSHLASVFSPLDHLSATQLLTVDGRVVSRVIIGH